MIILHVKGPPGFEGPGKGAADGFNIGKQFGTALGIIYAKTQYQRNTGSEYPPQIMTMGSPFNPAAQHLHSSTHDNDGLGSFEDLQKPWYGFQGCGQVRVPIPDVRIIASERLQKTLPDGYGLSTIPG